MLQLAVLLFFQPQNTANWDAGSNIANEMNATHTLFTTALQITEGVWQSVIAAQKSYSCKIMKL